MGRMNSASPPQTIEIQGRTYAVQVRHTVRQPPEAPRLVVVSHVVNEAAAAILDISVRAIQHFTGGPHELWIVDNNSPIEYISPFLDFTDVNFVLNRTEPLPPGVDHGPQVPSQQEWGSYANAIALELAVRLVDPETHFFMSMHMDSLPCAHSWLDCLTERITTQENPGTPATKSVAAAGVRMDKTRRPDGVLHVLGCVVNFQIFQRLGLSFFPDLPTFDVGDKITVALREAGFDVFACRNTLWEPELEQLIDAHSPYRNLKVDRSLDDNNDVIFAHLGRGVRKAAGAHSKGPTVEEWIAAAESNMLKNHPRPKGCIKSQTPE